MTVPAFAEAGPWEVEYVLLVANVGNARTLGPGDLLAAEWPTTFWVGAGNASPRSDTDPPTLLAFDFQPRAVDASSGDQMVSFSATLADEVSGLAGPGFTSSPTQARFRSPRGQFFDVIFDSGRHLVSGDRTLGHYVSEAVVKAFSEIGVWKLEYFLLVDQVGNQVYLRGEEVASRGLPTELRVGLGS